MLFLPQAACTQFSPLIFDRFLSFLNSYHKENDHKNERVDWIPLKEKAPSHSLINVLYAEGLGLRFTRGEHMCGKHS